MSAMLAAKASTPGSKYADLTALLYDPVGEINTALADLDKFFDNAPSAGTIGVTAAGKKRKSNGKKKIAKSNGLGTGFGGQAGESMKQYTDKAALAEEQKDSVLQSIVEKLKKYIPMLADTCSLLKKLQDSGGWCTLCFQLLRNDSFIDVGKRMKLYRPFLSLLLQLSKHPNTMEFLSCALYEDEDEDEGTSDNAAIPNCQQLLTSLGGQARVFRQLQAGQKHSGKRDVEVEEAVAVADLIIDTEKAVNSFVDLTDDRHPSPSSVSKPSGGMVDLTGDDDMEVWIPAKPAATSSSSSGSSSSSQPNSSSKRQKTDTEAAVTPADEARYVKAMTPLRFAVVDMCAQIDCRSAAHCFYTTALGPAANNKQRMTRIAKEMATLSTNLPVEYGSAVFMRVDESRMDLVKALIIGPEGTPYENGCFEFDIQLPAQYPQVPPRMQLVTTGQGTVRFNPNLYNCGKVCLSLLGTWSGPGWDAQHSTLLQVLVSIQALILVPDPYFNEPGYHGTPSCPQSQAYNKNIRLQCMTFAMREQLQRPSPIFADVIRAHFRHKRVGVLQQLQCWAGDSAQHRAAAEGVEAALDALL